MSNRKVLINEVCMLDDRELTTLDEDPNWTPYQVVKIHGFVNPYVVFHKTEDKRLTEYTVCPRATIGLHLSVEGLKKFKELNKGD